MAAESADLSTKARHLRPREPMKKGYPYVDSPTGSATDTKKPHFAKMMLDDQDDELSANTTASHYIGGRCATKRKNEASVITVHNTPKRPRVVHQGENTGAIGETGDLENSNEELQDVYCWECHKECVDGALDCASCPRTYHPICVPALISSECGLEPSETWTCPVCLTIVKAECADTRSWAMQQLNIDQFCIMLGFVLQRMKHSDLKTSEAFVKPVPRSLLPDYYDIVFRPMDLSTLDKNIKKKIYASTEAFLEDAKWILHNSMVYNGFTNNITQDAKVLVKICRQELAELELCPDCYLNSCVRKDNWFIEPCTAPHCLVWAKLKGFPFWPAKALRVSGNNVDVRFFGAHDRAWIPISQVFLLSLECPIPIKNTKKYKMDQALSELNQHIRRLREKFGEFHFAPLKTEFKLEHLYFSPILFGKNLSNSETAKKIFSTLSNLVGKPYRDLSGDTSEDHTPSSADSKLISIVSADDQPAAFSIDDDRSSDTESRNNDSATPASRTSTLKETAFIDVGLSISQDSNDSIDARSMISQKAKESNGADNRLDQSPSQPSLRLKLNLSEINRRKLAEKTLENPKSTRNVAPSPDSTSTNGQVAAAATATITAAVPITLNGVDSLENSASELIVNMETPNLGLPEIASVGKVIGANGTGAKTSASEEPSAKKRSLQSVLEKMHSTVQQKRHRSTSPICNATAAKSVTPKSKQPESAAKKCSDKRVNAGASTSSMDWAAICEKYLGKVSDCVQSIMSEMIRELQPVAGSNRETIGDGQAQAQLATLRSEFAKMQCFYNDAIKAMKHTAKVTFVEVQQAMEAEKLKTLEEMKRRFEDEKKLAVAETKMKQWCANCGKEAVFYCCWNTSYCDYPCQQSHWPKHQATCAQIRHQSAEAAANHVVTGQFAPVQYVTAAGNRVNSSQNAAAGAGQQAATTSVIYTSTLPNASFIRTTAIPAPAGQQQQAVNNLAALVRKR